MAQPIASKKKDQDAELDYLFQWQDWLASGDTIASFVVTIDGPDAVLVNYLSSNTATAVRVWLRSGTLSKTYRVTCKITTASTPPRIDERILELAIV